MATILVHLANLLVTSRLINDEITEPYLDEIFHIPQSQQYCRGDFYTWDQKITTPPGLYWTSNLIVYVGRLLNYDLCTVNTLRFTNTLFSIGLYFVLLSLILTLSKKRSNWKTQLYALTLCWFPINHFFNFLYYTDPGSTFFVMLSYLLVKKKLYNLAGVIGIVSLTFRQTNVIWLTLFMMISIIDTLTDINHKKDDEKDSCSLYNPICSTVSTPTQALSITLDFVSNVFRNLPTVLPNILTFLLAIVLFAVFLVWNGGIVLGDRSNHIAGLHFPQLFYYTSFLSFFAAPWTLSKAAISSLFQCSLKRLFTGIGSCLVTLYLIHKYTFEHPFLLSDNRHYTFYIWKNIYRRHRIVRYLLAPAYVASGYLNIQAFAQNTSFLLTLGYIFAVVLSLVPSPLLELRYYIIPFTFYMIHIPPPSNTIRTFLALGLYLSIHVVTVYLLLKKPFTWPNEPDQLQRFLW